MANFVKCQFSLNLQLLSVDLKSAPVKHTATYCLRHSHQIHSSCTSISVWWQSNTSLWLSWTVSIPNWYQYYGMPPVLQMMSNFWRAVYSLAGSHALVTEDTGIDYYRSHRFIFDKLQPSFLTSACLNCEWLYVWQTEWMNESITQSLIFSMHIYGKVPLQGWSIHDIGIW